MDSILDEALMKEFIESDGVSGGEKNISRLLRREFEKYADEIVYDNLGSIFAVKKSKQSNVPHVLVTGHMDEVGFIVKQINSNGTVKALVLGEINKNCLLGAQVELNSHGLKGTILGFNEHDDALDSKGDVLIDFGLMNEDDVKGKGIHLGDRIAFSSSIVNNNQTRRILAKNWNGRYAPIMEIEFLKAVQGIDFDFDLYVGCTVQEQVGYRGIQTATNLVQPDLGIVLDTDQAFDYQDKVDDRI